MDVRYDKEWNVSNSYQKEQLAGQVPCQRGPVEKDGDVITKLKALSLATLNLETEIESLKLRLKLILKSADNREGAGPLATVPSFTVIGNNIQAQIDRIYGSIRAISYLNEDVSI